MKHFLKFAKYAALACIFLNTALLVDGACNNCPPQGPPGLPGLPGTPGSDGSCTDCIGIPCIQSCSGINCTQSCAGIPCTQSCANITCTQSCDVDPATCTQSCAGIPCTQSCANITCTQSCDVDPATCTQACAGVPCEQPCPTGPSYGTWFVPNLPVISVTTFSTVPFSIGEPQAPGAPLGITNVVGAFTLTNPGVYYVAYGICTVAGSELFQLTMDDADIVGGRIKAGLDEVIKPTVLMFVAPANAVIRLVNISPGTAVLGDTAGDIEVPSAYISFIQIQ